MNSSIGHEMTFNRFQGEAKNIRIKWLRLDSADGTETLKQHGFIQKECRRRFTGEKYPGNISLCRRVWASDDGEEATDWNELEQENLNTDNVCKHCMKLLTVATKQE